MTGLVASTTTEVRVGHTVWLWTHPRETPRLDLMVHRPEWCSVGRLEGSDDGNPDGMLEA